MLGTLLLMSINQFNFLDKNFVMDNGVAKIKIGKINCTIFRDLMFKYLAK